MFLELGWRLHQRRQRPLDHVDERCAIASRDRLVDDARPDRVDLAAEPAARLEQDVKRGRQPRQEPRPYGHVEVAHAVDVRERPRAVGAAGIAHGGAVRQLRERRVEGRERARQLRRGRRRHRVARGLEPVERRQALLAGRPVGMTFERRAQLALRVRSRCDDQRFVEGRREGLHAPGFQVHDPLAHHRAGAHRQRRPVVGDLTPRERPEEADRVVLRAVALPVAGDEFLALTRPTGLRRSARGDLVDGVGQRRGVLPRDGFPEQRAARHLGQPAALVARPECVEAFDREAGAADREQPPQRPVLGERRMTIHGRTLAWPGSGRASRTIVTDATMHPAATSAHQRWSSGSAYCLRGGR